jgi:hypothetical protein
VVAESLYAFGYSTVQAVMFTKTMARECTNSGEQVG